MSNVSPQHQRLRKENEERPMATASLPATPTWKLPDRGTMGIICLITTESALFSIFVVAYLFYIGKSLNGPYPKEILEYPWWASFCLLSSSATIVIAEHALKHEQMGKF